jgi:hypothetical protein
VPFILTNSQWKEFPISIFKYRYRTVSLFCDIMVIYIYTSIINKKCMAPYGKRALQISLGNWFKFGEKLLHAIALTLGHGVSVNTANKGTTNSIKIRTTGNPNKTPSRIVLLVVSEERKKRSVNCPIL